MRSVFNTVGWLFFFSMTLVHWWLPLAAIGGAFVVVVAEQLLRKIVAPSQSGS